MLCALKDTNLGLWKWVIMEMFQTSLLAMLVSLAGSRVTFGQHGLRASQGKEISFEEYLVAPVRIHLLCAKDQGAIQTTLLETDITRILGKLNGVWSQAGLHFYLESIVFEEATHQETDRGLSTGVELSELLELRPVTSRATNMFHIYYLKRMAVNGIFFPEAIFVKDTASLRKVSGGLDEPLPRVSSHELGHALGLPHRQDTTNLMASGTTGFFLSEEEIKRVRAFASQLDWIESAPEVMKRANRLHNASRMKEAKALYARLARIPARDDRVELANRRAMRVPFVRSPKEQ